jgi:hypothetical protein
VVQIISKEKDMTDAQDYKGGADIASMQHIGQRYTQLLEAQARIAELEALLKLITDRAEMSIGYNDDFFNFEWIVKKARAALKAKP